VRRGGGFLGVEGTGLGVSLMGEVGIGIDRGVEVDSEDKESEEDSERDSGCGLDTKCGLGRDVSKTGKVSVAGVGMLEE
jgi:hypothetical protein